VRRLGLGSILELALDSDSGNRPKTAAAWVGGGAPCEHRKWLNPASEKTLEAKQNSLTYYCTPGTLRFEPNMSAQERVTIKIPKALYVHISEIIKDTGFSSVTDFIVYVLRDVVSIKADEPSKYLSKTEVESIRKRLKSLGYL
jgi:hypothetical protein